MNKLELGPYLTRLVIITIISIAVVAAVNEGAYLLQKEKTDRLPQTIQLVIPAGTAERVAAGEETPSIPEKMIFVTSDVLLVKNEDSSAHQLGPIWVPAGASGKLELAEPNKYSYSCSFTSARYFGLDVRQPTTLGTRLTALGIAVPPTVVFLFIYGSLVFPIKPKGKPAGGAVA